MNILKVRIPPYPEPESAAFLVFHDRWCRC